MADALNLSVDGEVLERFLVSASRVNLIQGPWGSGKSRTCCYKIFLAARAQEAFRGVRRSRWYIVRNTFDDLKRTTVETWLGVFPEDRFGRFIWSKPFEHRIRVDDVDLHAVFLALDREEDRRKLLSAEVSGVWFNEFRELPRGLIDDADGRIERFPSRAEGGVAFPMIIGDTNAPREDHWFSVMSRQMPVPEHYDEDQRRQAEKPASWSIFLQPPALLEQKDQAGEVVGYLPNPKAENVKNLAPGYYANMVAGKTKAWIRVNVLNRPGQLVQGKAVFRQFVEEAHVARQPISALAGHVLRIGVDFGRTPAAIIGQQVFGRWRILAELCARDMGARPFARELKRFLAQRFGGMNFLVHGDPAGDNKDQGDDTSPFLMFRAEGVPILPAPSNALSVRIGAVEAVLTGMTDGLPMIQIDPGCTMLKAGLSGGYHYRRLAVTGERYSEEPEKNQYSHPCDALQYLLLAGGEGRALLTNSATVRTRPVLAKRAGGSVFDRRAPR